MLGMEAARCRSPQNGGGSDGGAMHCEEPCGGRGWGVGLSYMIMWEKEGGGEGCAGLLAGQTMYSCCSPVARCVCVSLLCHVRVVHLRRTAE